MGLSKAINLIELCLYFMANFRENLSKLVESLQTSVHGDWRGAKNNVKAFANWLIHSDSWFLIGWNGFSHVWESRFATVIGWKNFRMSFSCDRFYPKISVSMGSLESTQEARVALGYRLGQFLRFFRAFQASRVLYNLTCDQASLYFFRGGKERLIQLLDYSSAAP